MNGEVLLCGHNSVMRTSKVTKLGQCWSPAQDVWSTTSPSSVNSVSPLGKEPPTNTSMDSGVAGLRDTPVHTPGPLQNNQNTATPGKTEEYEIPKFVVDHSTKTTYMKGRFLGKGGFARVHELTDLTTEKTYAGKIIPKSRITKPHHKEKIAREIELHRHLRHKNVVRFHHYFEDDSNVYIILENCSRRSLVHVLKHRRTLTEPEVRYYMKQLAEGVEYIHKQNVIHRDLKLGNMFLTEDMVMKIGDFGLATRVTENKNVTICGTPNYIAPEVLNKIGYCIEADIWAMGCIMYALLVGQPPFETDTLKETYSRITSNKYVIPPLVTDPARDLIRRLLHPVISSRPSLDNILTHEFFTSGSIPRHLPPSACTDEPKFLEIDRYSINSQSLSQSPQSPQQVTQDIKKITSSVSTLRIPNPKQDSNKVSILDKDFGNLVSNGHPTPTSPGREDTKKKDSPTLSSCLKQKLSLVICSSEKTTSANTLIAKKREITSGTLYDVLAACLDNMPDDITHNPPSLATTPLFISKWIDYSNKYGFGYQLSDLSVGVFFNDLTTITMTSDKSRVEFHDSGGRITLHQHGILPAWLQERYQLLHYFAIYMYENLTDAGDIRASKASRQTLPLVPHIRRWDRTPKSIIMQLSNGTFQINFFKDHTKIILASDHTDVLVMYINSERQSFTYRLSQIAECGCDALVRERLVYALSCLRQYAELDGDEV